MKHFFLLAIPALALGICSCAPEPEPESCFSVSANESATPSETFSFIDCSQNVDSYLWDFGDGSTSTDANPTHVYNDYGTFKVTLTSENESGQNSSFEYIEIGKPRLVSGDVVSYTDGFLYPDSIWVYYSDIVYKKGDYYQPVGTAPGSGAIAPITSIGALGHFEPNVPLALHIRYAIGGPNPGKPDSFSDEYIGSFQPDLINQKVYQNVVFGSNFVQYEVNLTFELDSDYNGL